MGHRQVVIVLLALCGTLALTGCATGADAAPTETSASAVAATDEMTCAGFGDVLTITANADAGLRDGRMEEQEQQGWYRLATRVLDRVPVREEGAVSDAMVELKDAAPAIAIGVIETPGIGSAEWDSANQALGDACADVGGPSIEMFTGG